MSLKALEELELLQKQYVIKDNEVYLPILRITDPSMWYAGMTPGTLLKIRSVDLAGGTLNIWSREPAGYTNIVKVVDVLP